MTDPIKSMQLYPRADRIYTDLAALGYGRDMSLDVDLLNTFDQLHYHGTEALDAAIDATGMGPADRILEIGAGWGGCARYLALTSGADVTAVELQADYHEVASDLTLRSGLAQQVTHVQGDFLTVTLPTASFAHVVSWLALFHIPERSTYLARIHDLLAPGGTLFVEDLYARSLPTGAALQDLQTHLFPNSLVPKQAYLQSLEAAGFEPVTVTDMTADWTAFTANRLEAFRANLKDYEATHGADGAQALETFYTKMAGYFADGAVGGLRYLMRKRG